MKKSYMAPQIELVKLDNEIALALESNPPAGPNEVVVFLMNQDSNPYKMNV